MKTYIFITYSIVNIGGAQLYVNSKVKYLESLGWQVKVYSVFVGRIMIEGLKRFANDIIPELAVSPMAYSNQKREQIVNRMSEELYGNDEIIIESNYNSLSIWGEMLASQNQAKHIIYAVDESIESQKELFPYFKFKYDRGEFAVIKSQIIEDFFKPYFKVEDAENHVLRVVYSLKQIDDVDFDIDNIDTTRYTIGVVGRLNKPFVLKVSTDLKEYILNNPFKSFNVVYIGGDETGENITALIEKLFKNVSNCNLYMVGYRFPMPRKLMRLFDVCFSNSGAARAVANERILTISIDSNDLNPIGVLGITTINTVFRTKEPIMTVSYWLDELMNNKYNKNQIKNVDVVPEKLDNLKAHLEYIRKSATEKEYYTEFKKKHILKRTVLNLFGVTGYMRLYNIVANIAKR